MPVPQVQIPHVDPKKYYRKVNKAKSSAREEIKLASWTKHGFKDMDFWIDPSRDKVPRIDYHTVSEKQFIEAYESKNIPVVIQGATDDWPARKNWTIKNLSYRYRHEKFKVGEDDDENVYLILIRRLCIWG